MPIYSIQAPNGKIYDIEGPAGVSEAQLFAVVQQQIDAEREAPKTQRTGLLGDIARGGEQMLSTELTGLASLGGGNEAAIAGLERSKKISEKYPGQDAWEAVKGKYEKEGLPAAVGEFARQVPHALAEQAPQIAQTMGGAAAGAATPVPGGSLIGAFAPSYLQQYGGFLESQAEEQQKQGKPVDVSRLKAAAYAIPAAGIDVAANVIPMGHGIVRSVFGPKIAGLLERGATKEAEALAEKKLANEGFVKSLMAGTVKGAAVEVPGEVAQQFLDRAQSGRSLFDDEALSDYGRIAFQTSMLGPVGAFGRFADKSAAQANVAAQQRKEAQDAAQAAQVAQQLEDQKKAAYQQTPEYLDDITKRFQTAQEQYTQLKAAADVKAAKDDLAAIDAKKEAKRVFDEFKNSFELANVRAEYQQALPRIRQAQQIQTGQQTAMFPETGEGGVAPGIEGVLSSEQEAARYGQQANPQAQMFPQVPAAPTTETAQPALAELTPDYRQHVRALEGQLEQLQTMGVHAKTLEEEVELSKKAAKIEAALKTARDLVVPEKASPLAEIAALEKKRANAKTLGELDKLGKYSAKIIELKKQLPEQVQAEMEMLPFKGTSETTQQFNEKYTGPAAANAQQRLSTLQEEEQQAIEQARLDDEKARQQAEFDKRMSPERLAMQKMAQPGKLMGLPGFGTEAPVSARNAAMANIERALTNTKEAQAYRTADQKLSAFQGMYKKIGKPTPEMESHLKALQNTRDQAQAAFEALKVKATAEPQGTGSFQKGPGGGFTLFNEQGALQRPVDYDNLSQRLARALASPELDQNAYNFLRRVENVLPARTQDQGFLNMLDQQLTKIEQGTEGINAKAQMATQTKNIMGFDVPVERKVIRGPSAQAKPLSMQGELEPSVKAMEQAAAENAGQKALFPEAEADLGTIRSTRQAFIQATRSKAVAKAKEDLAAAKEEAKTIKGQLKAARLEETTARAATQAERKALHAAQQQRLEMIQGKYVDGQQFAALTDAQRAAKDQTQPELTADEKAVIDKDPLKVLGGYRAREKALTKALWKAQQRSRSFLLAESDTLLQKRDALDKAYKAAKSADERAALAPKLEAAESAYAKALNKATQEDIVWVGKQKSIDELSKAIAKVAWLEEGIESGRIATPEETAPASAKKVLSEVKKAKAAVAAQKAAAAEAKTRANAPTTSGEAVTRSEAAKLAKGQKTQYSGKGVGSTEEELKRRADARQELYKEAELIEAKIKDGKQPNVFDQHVLNTAARARAAEKLDKGTEASETTTAQQDRVSDEAAAAIEDGRILDALDAVAKSSKLPFIRDNAAALRDWVSRTRLIVTDDIEVDGKQAPAAYNSHENAILIRPDALTEANFVHEVVHAATMRALEGPVDKLSADQRAAKNELQAMFQKLTKDGVLTGEYAAKNIKEFASEVQSNAALRDRMDNQKWMGSTMLRRALNALFRMVGIKTSSEKANEVIERLYMQSGKLAAPTAAAAPAYTSAFVGNEPTKREKLEEKLFGFSTEAKRLARRVELIDRLSAADEGIARAQGAGVLSSLEAESAQYFMRTSENTSQAAGQFINHGPVRIVADKTAAGTEYRYEAQDGPNLLDMAEHMAAAAKESGLSDAEIERMTTVIPAGQRAEATPNGWARLMADDPAAAKAEYLKDKAYLDANPKVKAHIDAALKTYKTYNDGLVDFAEQCDYLSKEEANRLKSLPYVPFYRVDGNDIKLFTDKEHSITIGNIANNPELKQMLGDNQKILPIMTSAVQNTFMMTRAAMKNKAALETTDALYKAGFVSKRGNTQGPANASTVHYKYKGKPAFATIDADTFGIPAHLIVKGMEGIKAPVHAIVQAMGVPANMLRKFVTRNPAYAARQIIKEPVNAFLISGVDGTPVVNALKEMSQMRKGRSSAEEELMKGLTISSNIYSGNEEDMRMFLRDVAAGKGKWDKLMGAADTLALQADAATRAVIYRDGLAKGLTKRQAQFRAMESQNFNRRGLSPSIQMLNTMIPFFNAQIQGLDVLYRSLKGKMPFAERLDIQRKIKARAVMAATVATAYALMMSDDEDYEKATPEERYGNFFVHLPGIKDPLKLPVPFEYGALVFGLPQAVIDAAMRDTKASEAAKGIGKLLWQSAPSVVPAGVKPLVEAAYGETMYGPIESAREKETLQASERYRPETTGLAKAVGSITGEVGVSPLMLEHLTRGYTGTLGISAMHMLDPLFGEVSEKASTPASKQPFVGSMFQSSDGRFLVDRAYERMADLVQAKGTYEDLLKKGERARAESFAQRYENFLVMADSAGTFKQRMGQMFADERAIRSNPDLTTAEKDELLDRIKKSENEEAKAFYAATEKTTPR